MASDCTPQKPLHCAVGVACAQHPPDSEPLELLLNQSLVGDGLDGVEHDDDAVARTRRGDNLPA